MKNVPIYKEVNDPVLKSNNNNDTFFLCSFPFLSMIWYSQNFLQTDGRNGRQTDRHIDRRAGTQTERHSDRKTELGLL